MLNNIILFSLKNKLLIILSVIALIIAGIIELNKLPIDAVPDITNNQVQILTTAPSFAAQDIERKITFPIEQACSNIEGIKEIRSFSRFGLSVITIVFDDEKDIYWARQQISERLQKIQNEIPAEIGKPELAPITTGLGEIYQYIIRPKKGYENFYTLTELRDIQDWIVRRQLLGIKGVADVSSFGGYLKQYEISINPHQLISYQISINDILTALENNNQNIGSAFIEKNSMAYFIRSEGMINGIQDIENIVVKQTKDGIPIQIKDIAKVKIGHATRYGALVYTSKKGETQYETAGGIVMMLKGENSNEVIERVKNKIKEIQKNLPEGVIIEPFLDRTKMVNSTIHTVIKNLSEGILIVIFVLILLLGNIRYGIVVASVIPLSMLFAIIMMNLFNVSANLMSMGALDFGLIVDGSVIIVEAIMYQAYKTISKNQSFFNTDNIVFQSTSKMMNAAVFGQIIILIVYLPVLYFSGIEGKMFKPMAQTVIFALIGAFLLSITYVPVISAILVKKGKITHFHLSERVVSYLEKWYLKLFKKFFRKVKLLITSVLILFTISIYILIHLGGEFMPVLEEGDFAVETRLMTGFSLSGSIEYCKKLSSILAKEFPDEVEKIVCKIGSGEIPTDPMPIENADMMVILSPPEQWKKAKTFDELAVQMQNKISVIPGVATSFQFPVQMRFNELIAGAKQDVVCKIFGENIDSMAKYAHIIAEKISEIKGTEGIYEEPIFGQTQLVIKFDKNKLAQYNVNIKNANLIIQSFNAGVWAGNVYENERKYDIVIRIDSSFKNIKSLGNLTIPNENGEMIPLNQIAHIIIQTDINQIQRESAKRRIIVGFNVRGRDVESVINELQQRLKNIKFPAGYFIKFGGSFENLETARERLMITVPIALALVFLMLYFSFQSIKISALVYSAIPMSIIGGIFFLYFRQMPFSISAGVGFVVLFGISVLNGVVLVSEFNQLRTEHTLPIKIILTGIRKRFRPVIMTATVAALGFLPMFLNTSVGANVQKPLATVVIGGLFTSTILTMFILPLLYYQFILKKSSIRLNVSALIIILILTLNKNYSQTNLKVNLQMCIDSALKYHPQIQAQKILTEYHQALVNTAFNIPKTDFNFQIGQYNSIYQDNALHFQQSLLNPFTYVQQKKLFQSEVNIAALNTELQKKNIKNIVAKLFYDIAVFNEKIQLLQKQDSILKLAEKILQLKFDKGDISITEKSILQNMIYQNQVQLYEAQNEKLKQVILLQILTNIKNIQDIEYTLLSIPFNLQDLSSTPTTHLQLQILNENILLQKHKVKLEQSQLLPDFNIGYTSQTLTGWGSDNIYYPKSQRFQYFNIGIQLPIFFHSFKNKISAEKKLIHYNELQMEWQKNQFNYQVQSLLIDFKFYQNILNQYQTQLLPNAQNIIKTAQLNYEKGNINFLEWSNYIQQALQIQINYFNYTQNQNHIISDILYYYNAN
ncbi:MAG: CusA/CzcA family heavy metal efflux RND transporter [Bacteroidota bacterium]